MGCERQEVSLADREQLRTAIAWPPKRFVVEEVFTIKRIRGLGGGGRGVDRGGVLIKG